MGLCDGIAVDGTSGSGKSSLGKLLADLLGYEFISTGKMYRAFALRVKGITPEEVPEHLHLLLRSRVEYDVKKHSVFLNGVDVTACLDDLDIALLLPHISPFREVRVKVREVQHRAIEEADRCLVLEGRDIGTVVWPSAPIKFFLTASLEERAKRRLSQLVRKGVQECSLAKVAEDLDMRDRLDMQRHESPLVQAADAILIDSTGRDREDTLALMIREVERRRALS